MPEQAAEHQLGGVDAALATTQWLTTLLSLRGFVGHGKCTRSVGRVIRLGLKHVMPLAARKHATKRRIRASEIDILCRCTPRPPPQPPPSPDGNHVPDSSCQPAGCCRCSRVWSQLASSDYHRTSPVSHVQRHGEPRQRR